MIEDPTLAYLHKTVRYCRRGKCGRKFFRVLNPFTGRYAEVWPADCPTAEVCATIALGSSRLSQAPIVIGRFGDNCTSIEPGIRKHWH